MQEVFASAEFWVLVAFLIVVSGTFKYLAKSVATTLDMRAKKIKSKLEEANRLREEAQELLVEYQRRQRDAIKKAEDIVSHARTEANQHRKRALTELEESIKRRENQALSRITQVESQTITEIRNLAVDIAIIAVKQLIVENLSQEKAESLVDQAIRDLPSRLQYSE